MKKIQEDLMTLDQYCLEDMLMTLITKDAAHTINAFGMIENLNSFGNYVKTEEGKCRIVIGGEFNQLIYRGQNKDFQKFKSSFGRINITEEPLEHCVQWIKKEEFKEFFKKTPYYLRLPKELGLLNCEFDFDLEALAQHYEFKTNYLDITKSFNIALFFAYTECINGIYHPITDFQNHNPCIYISSIRDIYRMYREKFKIVGFQVSPRPISQCAMALDLENLENVEKLFTKIELPKNAYFSTGVYNSYQKGYMLFQPEFLAKSAQEIKSQKIILKHLLQRYCEIFNVDLAIEEQLVKSGYILNEDELNISKNEYENINLYIDNFLKPFISNNVGYRRVAYPQQ